MSGQRFRRLTDLFVRGAAVAMPDGSHLWVQAINSYERDECVSDAQVARSRFVMALRADGGERVKVEARMAEQGRDRLAADLAQAKGDAKQPEVLAAIEDDPEWAERLRIMRRTDADQAAQPFTEQEQKLLENLGDEWFAEVQRRTDEELEFFKQHYRRVTDEELLNDYLEMFLERRGGDKATAEYVLTEMWYSTRYCDAVDDPDSGDLDHTPCKGHPERVFPTKTEARAVPDALRDLLLNAISTLGMAYRDPKGSASPASSSDSSPTPSAAEESTPSTSTETLELPPGT